MSTAFHRLLALVDEYEQTQNIKLTPERNLVAYLERNEPNSEEWYHKLNVLVYRLNLLFLSIDDVSMANNLRAITKNF